MIKKRKQKCDRLEVRNRHVGSPAHLQGLERGISLARPSLGGVLQATLSPGGRIPGLAFPCVPLCMSSFLSPGKTLATAFRVHPYDPR